MPPIAAHSCCSSHQEAKSIFPPPESALHLPLLHTIQITTEVRLCQFWAYVKKDLAASIFTFLEPWAGMEGSPGSTAKNNKQGQSDGSAG